MFIKIINPQSVHKVDKFIKDKRAENGGTISPEIAKEVLSFTNNYINIKFLLKEIKQLKDVEEKLKFKDVIFSMVTDREYSDGSIEMMKDIAKECGFNDEFERYIVYQKMNKNKTYHNLYPQIVIFDTKEEMLDETVFWYMGAKKIPDILICNAGGRIDISDVILPGVCCFPNSPLIYFERVKGLKEVKCKENCVLNFAEMSVPKDVEFDKCKSCYFNKCNFIGVDELNLGEGVEVNFYNCNRLPFRIDLSKCKSVRFGGSDFSGVRRVVLKNTLDKNMFKDNTIHSLECEILTADEFLAMVQMQKGLVL